MSRQVLESLHTYPGLDDRKFLANFFARIRSQCIVVQDSMHKQAAYLRICLCVSFVIGFGYDVVPCLQRHLELLEIGMNECLKAQTFLLSL